MTLRITSNVEAMGIHRSLDASAQRLATAMRRLSSGLRINAAADDPSGLSVSERMRSQIRGLEQAGRNIQDGMSLLQTIEGALSDVHSILQRARDLAVQYNSGILTTADKGSIRGELITLSNELGYIERTTTFNGIQLFGSVNSTITLQVGANDGETISFNLTDIIGPNAGCLANPATFLALPWLDADVTGFDNHIAYTSIVRARFGAVMNRLGYALGAAENAQQNLMEADSRIRDVDIASEITAITREQILQQSAQTMLRFANTEPARLLQLLIPKRS